MQTLAKSIRGLLFDGGVGECGPSNSQLFGNRCCKSSGLGFVERLGVPFEDEAVVIAVLRYDMEVDVHDGLVCQRPIVL